MWRALQRPKVDGTSSLQTPSRASNPPSEDSESKNDREPGYTPSSVDPSPQAQPRTINVVIFGETGVGKSSVVNLIAQKEIAKVSEDVVSCTMQSARYDISFDGMDFAIFDTIGLEEVNSYLGTINIVYPVIMQLSAAGGIHLLLFCMRGGRITATTQNNYRFFFECLCSTKVPIVFVITGLEREVEMEDWWVRGGRAQFERYGMPSSGHACVTAIQDDIPGEDTKYAESQKKIRRVLRTCALTEAFLPEQHSWAAEIGKGIWRFSGEKQKKPQRKHIIQVLTQRRELDAETAGKIADMMLKGNTKTEDRNKDQTKNKEADDDEVTLLKKTVKQLRTQLAESQRKADSLTQILRAHERKHKCEVLYAQGHSIEAAECLLEIVNTMHEAVKANRLVADWMAEFTNRCISTLERIGDEASNLKERDNAILAYSLILSLGPPTPNSVLAKWARMILTSGSISDALEASTKFRLSRFIIFREVCNILEENDRVSEAIIYFRHMQCELAGITDVCERTEWELDFQQRCAARLEKLGSIAMDSEDYNRAVDHFSTILSLDLVSHMEALIKRSKARTLMKLWEDALSDADKGVKLDPSSYQGYEMRHAALHGARRHAEAVEAFHMMLSKLEQSPDEHIRELRHRYADIPSTIQHIVEGTIRDMPLVLIDTTTGHLCDKKQQAEAFKALPIYNELLSSMTTKIDYARIWREVKNFYRYVMLSHKWEDGEPLLQKVERITVYELEMSFTNMKLRDFCTLARRLGFRWAWSDTCCVDKENKRVLEESLVAMFTWYRGSSVTIVYLRGVSSLSEGPDGLRGSIWNTRAWTYQEYIAAEVVQFYTEDWKPYLGLTMFNHKDSPAIISEMQQATTDSVNDITVLHPGLDKVREKLSLASMRKATLVEDIAYSLLGIFKASIPVQYGERDRAVGRLLEYILTGSGNVIILAWTGRSGGYNSCLPIDLTVYNQVLPPHVPQPIENSEMNKMVLALRSSMPDLSLTRSLYSRLIELPPPVSLSSRLRLPGIVFRLAGLVRTSSDEASVRSDVYRATTSIFGNVEIQTADDLTKTRHLYFVHPWIRPLLDQEFTHGAADLDETTQAVRFLTRLRQPFGALLLEQMSRMEYRRVASDSLIMVRVREEVPLTNLIDNIRTIEIQ